MPLTITSADMFNNRTKILPVQVGEAVSEGQVGYGPVSGKYYLADADELAKAEVKGVYLKAASTDEHSVLATGGAITLGTTMTVGEPYFLSPTAGGICLLSEVASNDYLTFLFVAETATKAVLDNIVASGIARA